MPKTQITIRIVRDQRVIIDADLAGLYGVQTKALNRAVGRNIERFPKDFLHAARMAGFEVPIWHLKDDCGALTNRLHITRTRRTALSAIRLY